MNRAQIILLGIAAAAGVGAFALWQMEAPQQNVRQLQTVEMEQVLIATQDLGYGMQITDASTRWIDWPKESTPPGSIMKSLAPDAKAEIDSAYVRHPILRGELIHREGLVKGIFPGVMPSIVTAGNRAVGVDATLANAAGGFLLPEDHVDVYGFILPTENSAPSGRNALINGLIAENVRVLAVASSAGKDTTTPRCPPGYQGTPERCPGTVTLELTPAQTRCVLEAQKLGALSLVARSFSDALPASATTDEGKIRSTKCRSSTGSEMIIVRRGEATILSAE